MHLSWETTGVGRSGGGMAGAGDLEEGTEEGSAAASGGSLDV